MVGVPIVCFIKNGYAKKGRQFVEGGDGGSV
jgi:hypothetical protein